MSVEMFKMMARNFYLFAGVLAFITLIVFFRFQIWKIVGDLSGVNAKRGIKAISKQKMAMESHSQGLFGMKLLQEERAESFLRTENTEVMRPEKVSENDYVIEETEYTVSAE